MWPFTKKKVRIDLEIDESNIICSKCLKKMEYVKTEEKLNADVCPKCKGVLISKFDLEKAFVYFINKEKKFLD